MASAWTCHGGVTVQLDAQSLLASTESNIVWQSAQGVCLIGDAADWQMAGNIVENKTGAAASPLVFTNTTEDATACHLVLVIRTGPTIRMRETIVCGERNWRIDCEPVNEPVNTVAEFERDGCCEVASHKINGVENAPLVASQTQICEVDFGMPLKLSEVALFSDFGRGEWLRGFGGPEDGSGFLEMIGFSNVPSEDALVAVRRYLDFKHGLNLGMPNPTAMQVHAAMNEGVQMDNLFATLLIVR